MRGRGPILVLVAIAIPFAAASCQKGHSKQKPPEITALRPDVGLEGDVVVIEGRRFSRKIPNNDVTFNGVQAQVLLARNEKLTVLVPVGAASGPVKVERGKLESNEAPFVVLQFPTITDLVPDFGPEGRLVTIQGRYFGVLPQDNIVRFGGLQSPVLTAAPDELTVFVPPGAAPGDVTVEVGPNVSNGVHFLVTTPMLTSVEEFFGVVDSSIVLSGARFSPVPSENIVRFNGIQSPVLFASSFGDSLSTTVPSGTRSGLVTVEVTGGRGTTNGLPFCLEGSPPPAPTITAVAPGTGAVGDAVQIDGSNFSPNPTDNVIRFNGTMAPVLGGTGTTLQTEVPTGAISGPITVEVAGQIATFAGFNVTTPPPPIPGLIAIVSDRSPPDSGIEGDWVVIRGSDFSDEPSNNHIFFNGVEGRISGASPDALLAYVPFTSSGLVTVDVGSQITGGGLPFTVVGPPATGTTFDYFAQTIPAPSDSVIFVIDISGTMSWAYPFTDRFGNPVSGTRLDFAIDRTAAAVDALPDNVMRFNILAYDCGVIQWDPVSRVADAASKATAINWMTSALAPSGSSDTGKAVAAALSRDPTNRTVTLISDGSPTCGPTSEAAHLCEILTANRQGAAIHTFAIQPFGDFAEFMRDMADLSGGTYNVAN